MKFELYIGEFNCLPLFERKVTEAELSHLLERFKDAGPPPRQTVDSCWLELWDSEDVKKVLQELIAFRRSQR